MAIQLIKTDLFNEWLSFTKNKAVMECDFSDLKHVPVEELLGSFSIERLVAFGEHASGSVLSFYSSISKPVDEAPVAWLDSEGSPCIIISKNFRDFLSILPYGMGFIYTVAAVIENNLGDDNLIAKATQRINKNAEAMLEDSKKRFLDVDTLINWLKQFKIEVSNDPVKLIVEAHEENSDLTPWLSENLT